MSDTSGSFDVIVVGGGIVGCAAAYMLVQRGFRAAIVERGRIGRGTTSNSFAWVNATSKVADPGYHRLNAQGGALYRELATEFGEERMGLHRTGMLQWAGADHPQRRAELEQRVAELDALDYPVTWVGNRALVAMEPHVRFADGAEALYALADPWLDAPRFARCLADEVIAAGSAVMEDCAALELALDDEGAVSGLVTERGTLGTTRVLIAAGPGTPEVLGELTGYEPFATRFPMYRAPGLLVTTPDTAPHRPVRHILYTDDPDDLHIRPAPNGGLRIGANDTDGRVAEDDSEASVREAARILLERTREYLPAFPGAALIDECELVIGVRPVPEDGKTVAGALPGAEGVYVIATHSGVTLAPAIGKLMAEVIVDGVVPEALAPFGLERFQGFRHLERPSRGG